LRLKKFNDIVNENKRKQKILEDKIKELQKLKEEVIQYKDKANERDSVYNKNKDLVTK
jgi:hypothetical protein